MCSMVGITTGSKYSSDSFPFSSSVHANASSSGNEPVFLLRATKSRPYLLASSPFVLGYIFGPGCSQAGLLVISVDRLMEAWNFPDYPKFFWQRSCYGFDSIRDFLVGPYFFQAAVIVWWFFITFFLLVVCLSNYIFFVRINRLLWLSFTISSCGIIDY